MRFLSNTTVDKISLFCLQHIIFKISTFSVIRNGEFNPLEYLIFLSKTLFWFYTKNLTCRVLKILRQKCIVLKFLNPKFQLLNLRKWWFYVGLKPWHYLWDTLYLYIYSFFWRDLIFLNVNLELLVEGEHGFNPTASLTSKGWDQREA